MKVEVINTGTELLLGSVVNTHLAFMGQELFPLGLRIERQVTVPDGLGIRQALEEAFARCQILFVTGGLGPTSDDLTRDIAAELLGRELVHDAAVMRAISRRFAARGLKITSHVRRQADVPRGATVLANANGTAPGLYLSATPEMPHLFLLPGPPRELRPMFIDAVVPILRQIAPPPADLTFRNYRITGMGESEVEEAVGERLLAISELELGYCARPGELDVRLIGAEAAVTEAGALLLERLGPYVFATGYESLEHTIVAQLTRNKETLAVAESCTGGFLAHRITNVPGASAVFLAGLTTYADAAKTEFLSVPPALIADHGAVSAEVARAMAEGTLHGTGATHALSTTGIAGPEGGTREKPVGTVFIGCAARERATTVERRRFATDRETFKWLTTQTALDLLRRRLLDVAAADS